MKGIIDSKILCNELKKVFKIYTNNLEELNVEVGINKIKIGDLQIFFYSLKYESIEDFKFDYLKWRNMYNFLCKIPQQPITIDIQPKSIRIYSENTFEL